MHIPWSSRRGGHNLVAFYTVSLSLSCNKHWEGNNDMSLKETGFEDVHLNLVAQ